MCAAILTWWWSNTLGVQPLDPQFAVIIYSSPRLFDLCAFFICAPFSFPLLRCLKRTKRVAQIKRRHPTNVSQNAGCEPFVFSSSGGKLPFHLLVLLNNHTRLNMYVLWFQSGFTYSCPHAWHLSQLSNIVHFILVSTINLPVLFQKFGISCVCNN